MPNLSMKVKEIEISDGWMRSVLVSLPGSTFTHSDFSAALKAAPPLGLKIDEAVRPILQHLKRKGVITYDKLGKCWRKQKNITAMSASGTIQL